MRWCKSNRLVRNADERTSERASRLEEASAFTSYSFDTVRLSGASLDQALPPREVRSTPSTALAGRPKLSLEVRSGLQTA